MTSPMRIWRAREDRAMGQLLREAGVGDETIEQGGPDGEELSELIFAEVETWNAFGLVAQDWDAADDDVHERLTTQFVVVEEDDWTWRLEERAR
jgi:hypothetical protein